MIMSRDQFRAYLVELIMSECDLPCGPVVRDVVDKIIETLETNDVRISSSQ
jgi:hypothetical protein